MYIYMYTFTLYTYIYIYIHIYIYIQTIDVPKLEDAHWAGGNKSTACTLVLTEGDSAKALAVAG
jgi:hypothetical protein